MSKYINPLGFCIVCGEMGVDLHHIKSRGAGGRDTVENLIPLCRKHHTMIHQYGLNRMAREQIAVRYWLEESNYIYCGYTDKWHHVA